MCGCLAVVEWWCVITTAILPAHHSSQSLSRTRDKSVSALLACFPISLIIVSIRAAWREVANTGRFPTALASEVLSWRFESCNESRIQQKMNKQPSLPGLTSFCISRTCERQARRIHQTNQNREANSKQTYSPSISTADS